MDNRAVAGSEIAAVRLAEEFVRRGMRVVVVAPCKGSEGVYSGIHFLDSSDFPPFAAANSIDVFIGLRYVNLFDYPMRARKKLFWLTDVHALGTQFRVNDVMPRLYNELDGIVCQSSSHVESVLNRHRISREKITVIGLGVDASRFDVAVEKQPKRFVFASCPDRGLDTVIDLFPFIRRKFPDASLHVFYGFELWDHMIRGHGNEELKPARDRLSARCEQPGVFVHGRVGQREIALEFLKSDIWFYPTRFVETYCITALEAQMGGAVCVCSDLGALQTTVADRGILLPGDAYSADYRRYALDQVFAILEDTERRRRLTEKARDWAIRQTWEQCANAWMELFSPIV